MGTICLSIAPILRCQSLNRVQSGILFIPPVLEVVFSLTLVVSKRGKDRKHLLLAGEGIVYAVLALIDLLAHIIPSASNNLAIFRGLDIAIGALSTIPLLLFTLFLWLFTTREIVPAFPERVSTVARYTLAVFPPLVVIFNELGSFLSISYRVFGRDNGGPVIAVGYTNDMVRAFMNGLVLVLFVLFQALTFSAVFLRLIKAFLNQHRIESTTNGPDNEVHLFKGSGWIAAGIKFGAVEGLIGFAEGGFGEALTRRILRFLGRACLIIGVLKGVDTVEDFRIFSFTAAQPPPKRRSALHNLISNPRHSTFQQIGGYDFQPGMVIPAVMATTAVIPVPSTIPRSRSPSVFNEKRPDITVTDTTLPSRPTSTAVETPSNPPTLAVTTNSTSPLRPLVTVRRGRNRAPTLVLTRLSDLKLTSPFRSSFRGSNPSSPNSDRPRPYSASYISNNRSSRSSSIAFTVSPPQPVHHSARHTMAGGMLEPSLTGARPAYAGHKSRRSSVTLPPPVSRFSAYSSVAPSSPSLVHNLTEHFPGIPPRITPTTRQSSIEDALKLMENEDELYPVHGVRRHSDDFVVRERRHSNSGDGGGLVRRGSSVKRKPVPKPLQMDQNPFVAPALTEVMSPSTTLPSPPPSPVTRRYTAPDNTHVITDFDDNFRTESKSADEYSPVASEPMGKKSRNNRIKSVGSVPRRRTPVPTQTFTRESAVAEWFDISRAQGLVGSDSGSETATIRSVDTGSMRSSGQQEREESRSVRASMRPAEVGESFLHY
ncbi:hypothetical protein BXZ70DRAFT_930678 [Cristinia sonorae]|uniref:Uncharacterized protein n=1 Tax=Cristinia sonorae TaxID=1940300 RepID=A0A8K0UTD4_9AGAR|nr:hypothetical protein BXZ70DRAFT_930678 [Cristinia sonorae]